MFYSYMLVLMIQVPVPKQITGYQQTILPFNPEVWQTFGNGYKSIRMFINFWLIISTSEILTGLSVGSVAIVLYLTSKVCTMKSNRNLRPPEKAIINNKSIIDFITMAFFVLLKPRTSRQFAFRTMWKKSKAGFFLVIGCIWGGYILFILYKKNLLSNLTVPVYEKPLRNIKGKISIMFSATSLNEDFLKTCLKLT